MPRSLRTCAALSVLVLAPAVRAQTAPSYSVEFLGVATATTGINNAGVAIGWTSAGSGLRGWVAAHGMPVTLLPLPPGRASSMVYGINDLGVIVGHVATGTSPEFSGVAAMWTPNASGSYDVVELGTLPGTTVSAALAINTQGDVVGYAQSGIFHKPVLFSAPGGPQDLSATGIGDPKSINDARVLVDGGGKRLDLQTMAVQNLGVPTGLPSNYVAVYPNAINATNQVVGAAVLATSGNCSRQAARYTDGIGWQILSGCGQYNDAHDINAAGDLVMRVLTAPYVRFEGIGTFRVEDLIANTVGHWAPYNTFYSVVINDARQIVLPASNASTGESGMVLLTPIAEVGTPYCLGDGTGTACPCGNSGFAGNGCANASFAAGAGLSGSGQAGASLGTDTLVLSATNIPGPGLFFQGTVSTAGAPFGDGLLCVTGTLVRLGIVFPTGAAASYPGGLTPIPIHVAGGVASGDVRHYQCWYRDANVFCAPETFNLTQGLTVTWGP